MNHAELSFTNVLTLGSMLQHHATHQPDALAILGEDLPPIQYAELWRHVELIGDHLQRSGIMHTARVAIALPNGPEMAVSLLGTATYTTCVPLSTAYQHQECRHYLESTRSEALIIKKGDWCPAYEIASELGLPIFEIDLSLPAVAKRFSLISGASPDQLASLNPVQSCSNDIALILHTSGTTAKPKRVPLNQAVLLKSARNIAGHLQLLPADRCLNVMALFHSHGIVGALLSSIVAGSSVVCTRRFDQNNFFESIAQFQPTWYTATPTIHQAILENEETYRRVAPLHRFRFVRSSSAPLSPAVSKRLENMMHSQVIESFGMTEWSQMASTPLSGPIKPGSVGLSTGVEVAVQDDSGRVSLVGVGNVLVRGSVLADGYEGDPIATEQAFRDGWFVTGDHGRIDSDGYLFLTGRSKEIINRGGEKISPREIDEALLEHPDVLEAAAFAAPHPSLGEDVIAAVVLRKGAALQEAALRSFLFERLANFKIPSNVLFIAEIPKSASGKVQRLGLYEQLASLIAQPFIAPRNHVERVLEAGFREVLGCGPVGIDDNFFHLGGDSLAAVSLFSQLDEILKRELPISILLTASTIRQLAQIYSEGGSTAISRALIPIRTSGALPPLFAMPGIYGNVLCFTSVSQELGTNQPLFGLQSVGLDGVEEPIDTIEQIARRNLDEIRQMQPHGPYFFIGACFGATVAFEMARQLISLGEQVAYCALIDPSLRGGSLAGNSHPKTLDSVERLKKLAIFIVHRLNLYRSEMDGLGVSGRLHYLRSKLLSLSQSAINKDLMHNAAREISQRKVYEANLGALLRHRPLPLAAGSIPLDIYQTQRRLDEEVLPHSVDWRNMAGTASCFLMPGKDSGDMLRGDNVKALASILSTRLGLARERAFSVPASQNPIQEPPQL